jgi:hypothetical protein
MYLFTYTSPFLPHPQILENHHSASYFYECQHVSEILQYLSGFSHLAVFSRFSYVVTDGRITFFKAESPHIVCYVYSGPISGPPA